MTAKLPNLLEFLQLAGVNAVGVPGWQDRRSSDKGFEPVGYMNHHTAGTNSLKYVTDRALVQFHTAKNGVVSVVSQGRTGHPGKGSNLVLQEVREARAQGPDAYPRRLKDDAYGYRWFWGNEVENKGDGTDPYPDAQVESLMMLAAAIFVLQGWQNEPGRMVDHREWTRRKIDMNLRTIGGRDKRQLLPVYIAKVEANLAAWQNPDRSVVNPPEPSPVKVPGHRWRFDRVLGKGDRGDDVRELQRTLAVTGNDPGPADGVFGPKTEAAVRALQRTLNVMDDGLWGPASAAALERLFAWLDAEAKRKEAELAKAEAEAAQEIEQATPPPAQPAPEQVPSQPDEIQRWRNEAAAANARAKEAEAEQAEIEAELADVRAELVDARNRLEEAQVARANAEARMAEMEAAPNPDPKTEGRRENEPALARVGSALIELVRLVTPFLTPTEKS